MNSLVVVGIVVFFFGLLASIALHELGHLSFAKLFGVRTTQYMVGFGPTIWSRQVGETQYGLKAIPLGGYIRMIGMLAPRKGETGTRPMASSPWRGLIDTARNQALEEVGPGDEDRVFYRKKWWQKTIIMFGGPFMNLLLAAVFLSVVAMGIGVETAQPVVSQVSKCMIQADQQGRDCANGDPATPAAKAGLQAGDRILTFNGGKIHNYAKLQDLIRGSGGRTITLGVERGGRQLTLTAAVVMNRLPSLTDDTKTVTVGFLGITPTVRRDQLGPGAVASEMKDLTTHTVGALVDFPQKMVGVFNAAFDGKKRDPNGPIGVVGASRIGGQIAASKEPALDKLAFFLTMLGTVNFAVGMFNLVPLLPLDGGHIAGALWEGIKRFMARILRRPDPGHVDVAKALPLAYAMAAVIMVMGVLLVYADLVNPVKLTG
jgi:membrane-associated protease RseP (regulator of RpoE activity)